MPEARTYPIDGFTKPAWATEVEADEAGYISFARPASDKFTTHDSHGGHVFAPELTRCDDYEFDIDGGALKYTVGAEVIHICDNVDVQPAEARKLAALLTELADIAEAGRRARASYDQTRSPYSTCSGSTWSPRNCRP